jgi:hypothetical protein
MPRAKVLFVVDDRDNSVLNWHSEPQKELHLYGEAFWNAAKKLLENDRLDKTPMASFDAAVIVYLYRHALELFLKEILIGPGAELIDPRPAPETVTNASHSLTRLLPDVRRIFAVCDWEQAFGSAPVLTFDDFTAIVEEFERTDPSSFSFRYPIRKDLTPALGGPFAFSVLKFAQTMDEVLATLSGACDALPEIVRTQAEIADEALQYEHNDTEPVEYDAPDHEDPVEPE